MASVHNVTMFCHVSNLRQDSKTYEKYKKKVAETLGHKYLGYANNKIFQSAILSAMEDPKILAEIKKEIESGKTSY